jgi:antitoxin component YwqK of YwqJK toxin-antitoxin module
MKKYTLFTLLILSQFIIFSCSKTLDEDKEGGNLTVVKGYLVYKGENFTGTVLKKYPGTSQLGYKFEFKDGLRDGKQLEYYNNGQVKEESETVNGRYNGVVLKYWENGRIKSKENYDLGEKGDGVHEAYNENGVLISFEKYLNKERIEYTTYNWDGKITGRSYKKGDSSIIEYYEKGKLISRQNNGISVN